MIYHIISWESKICGVSSIPILTSPPQGGKFLPSLFSRGQSTPHPYPIRGGIPAGTRFHGKNCHPYLVAVWSNG